MTWIATPLVSDRLTLRPFADGDRPFLTGLMRSPDVRAYLGGPLTAEQVAEALAGPMGRRWGVFCVVRRDSGEPIGTVSLSRERGELEISYQFLPEHWGQGFAREAAGLVIDWIWETTDALRLIAVTQEAHGRSRALLETLGMVAEGEFEEFGAVQVQYVLSRDGHGFASGEAAS